MTYWDQMQVPEKGGLFEGVAGQLNENFQLSV